MAKYIYQSDYTLGKDYYNKLLNKLFFGGNLKKVTVGGASIPEDIIDFYTKMGIQVYQGYGLTETSPMISVNSIYNNRIGSVGKILDCNEVRISDQNEIIVSGDNVFNGYFNNNSNTGNTSNTSNNNF